MNFEYYLERRKRQIDEAKAEVSILEKRFDLLCEKTRNFLAIAESLGVKAVCVGVANEKIKTSVTWSFHPGNSIFCEEEWKEASDEYGRPAAWELARRAGIYAGCGNNNQAQCNLSDLIDGYYELRDGKWLRQTKEEEQTK